MNTWATENEGLCIRCGDEEDTPCDCGECRECDERAYEHHIDQQTEAQIERMYGIED